MAETKKSSKKPKSSLIGNQAKPVVLDDTTKLDIDTKKTLVDNIIEAGLTSRLDISALDRFTTISNARDQIYQMIDTMCNDSAVSAIVRTYTDDVCCKSDNEHIVWCESENPSISKFVNYLLNVMNVDKNIGKWVYCLIKYGDVYLRLYRESEYQDALFKTESRQKLHESLDESVNVVLHSSDDNYSYYIEMVPDPSTMYELTRHGQTFGYIETPNNPVMFDQTSYIGGTTGMMSANGQNGYAFAFKTSDVNVYQADDFVHGALEDNIGRFPETVNLFIDDVDTKTAKRKTGSATNTSGSQSYTVRRGKSLLYDSYKIWREKALLESAILLSRITRSGIVRKVAVEVGDMPKEQVTQTLRRVKALFEQHDALNEGKSFSEYTNPSPVENFIYYATHNGQGAISVESVGGDYDPKQLTDLDWWNTKFYSSYGVPKQYFGWTEDGAGFNGGSALSVISSVYAKGVERIQNTILQTITDAINLILLNKGCKAYLNNFVLRMRAPLTSEEKEYRSNFGDKINAVSNVNSLFTDIEDKARRLAILKSLVTTLHLGDEVSAEIQKEIDAAEAEKKKAAKEEEAKSADVDLGGGNSGSSDNGSGGTDLNLGSPEPEETSGEEEDLDLAPMPDEEIKEENFKPAAGTSSLTEDQLFEDEDDLPTPEEADADRDFSENN